MNATQERILRPLLTANPAVVTAEFARQCAEAAELIQELAGWLAPNDERMLAIGLQDPKLYETIKGLTEE